eukprot:PhM_4_TR1043/c0_g1_i1/m.86851
MSTGGATWRLRRMAESGGGENNHTSTSSSSSFGATACVSVPLSLLVFTLLVWVLASENTTSTNDNDTAHHEQQDEQSFPSAAAVSISIEEIKRANRVEKLSIGDRMRAADLASSSSESGGTLNFEKSDDVKKDLPDPAVVKAAIERHGYYVVKGLLSPDEILALRRYILREFDTRPKQDPQTNRVHYTTHEHPLRYLKGEANKVIHSKTMVDMDMSGVQWLQNDPRFLPYLRTILDTEDIRVTQFHLSKNFMFHRFHYDFPYRTYRASDNNVKLFFFLQPHDNETHPAFSVVPRSHKRKVEVEHGAMKAPGQADFKPSLGDGVFMDSRVIHVGQVVPTSTDRILLHMMFGPNDSHFSNWMEKQKSLPLTKKFAGCEDYMKIKTAKQCKAPSWAESHAALFKSLNEPEFKP